MSWAEEDSEEFGYIHLSTFLKSFLEDREGQKHHKSSDASLTDDSPTSNEVLKPRIEAACPKISLCLLKEENRQKPRYGIRRGILEGTTSCTAHSGVSKYRTSKGMTQLLSEGFVCQLWRLNSITEMEEINFSLSCHLHWEVAGKPPTSFLADSGPRGQ